MEADILRNHRDLLDYSRSLWKENPYLVAYSDEMDANVFGPNGITLRMKIKETEDRVVHSAEEKSFLRDIQFRRERVAKFLEAKGRPSLFSRSLFSEKRGKATVQAGALDVFANQYIERKWKEWQRKENCTITGRLSYAESRQLRLKSCARDGDHFIRILRNSKYKFGFKIQHINSEWCDWNYTGKLDNGNVVRMGIEYDPDGVTPLAYHFIRQTAFSWQGMMPTPYVSPGESKMRERIPADEIIHYARFSSDAHVSRPAPWATPVMSNARHLAKYTEAAVIAARVGACSNVFFESAIDGQDGMTAGAADPRDLNAKMMQMNPGGMIGLPPGIRANISNPNNPNQNFGSFRNENLREFCAGLPGASFPVIGQNYAEINFSAGRLDRLTTTGAWMMLQQFDIDAAERRIFEEWLKMSLITQEIKLPLARFDKFNQPHFQGRRWAGVDPMKEIQAAAAAVSNKFSSRTAVIESGVCGESGDFEETLFLLAEEEMLLEGFGMSTNTTADAPQPAPVPEPDADDAKTADKADAKKATSKTDSSD